MSSTTAPAPSNRPVTNIRSALRQVFGGRPFHADGELTALAFGTNGTLWSVEEPGVLRGWEAATGRQTAAHHLHELGTFWVFRDDAGLLASGSDDLAVWDVPTGELRAVIPQACWVTALAFRGTSTTVATGHDDGTICLWDLVRQKQTGRLEGHGEPISALAFTPDGKYLASAGEDKIITLWDVGSGRARGRLVGHTDRIPAVAWHPSGQRIYSAGWDTTVRVWDAQTGQPIILLNSHDAQVLALALSRDGSTLACADSSFAVHVWRTDSHRVLYVAREHEGEVRCLAFSADGKTLATGGADHVARLWTGFQELEPQLPTTADVPEGRGQGSRLEQLAPAEPRAGMALSTDGGLLLSTSGGATLRLWDTATGQFLRRFEGDGLLFAAALSPDRRWAAAGGEAFPVPVWDVATGQRRFTLDGQQAPTTTLAFNADGTLLATASCQRGDVWLYDLATGTPVLLLNDTIDGCSIQAVAFHPKNPQVVAAAGIDWMATGGSDGGISLWDIPTRTELAILNGGSTCLAFHPGGSRLAAATLGTAIRVWDLSRKQVAVELAGHKDGTTALAYSADGRILASVGNDGMLRLWDADDGSERAGAELDGQIQALAFSPDGRLLYVCHANHSCYQLDVSRLA